MSATTPMLLLLGLLTLVVPLMGVTMALTPYLMPKRECFAVTVPDDAAADPYLRRLKRPYLAIMLALTAAATIACAAALALDPEHAFVAALVAAALVLCLGGYGLMLYFRAKVQRYKKAQGWVAEGRRSAGFVGDEPFPKPLSLAWGLLYVPVILITLTMGIVGYPAMPGKVPLRMDLAGKVTEWADKSPGIVAFPVLFVVFIAVCLTVAHWVILRSKKGSDPAMPAAGAWAYGMFARAQSVLLVGMGLLVSLLGPVIQLTFLGVLSMAQALVPIGVVVAVILVASTAVSLVYGQNGSRLLARVSADGRGGAMPRDNDRYWKGGIFYVNPDDPALFLPERFGIGWTINLGRPAAWAFVVGFALVIAGFIAASFLLT